MASRRLLPRARRPQDKAWFRITNSAGAAQVQIYNEIGMFGITADQFVADLQALDVDTINLRINSPGGEVFDGITIHHALRNHRANVHVIVDGLAASIASVIAMAGDKISMARGSQMMIHEGHTIAAGFAGDMRKCADILDRTSADIAGFYAARAGGTTEYWLGQMAAETWYNAEEAVRAGLADEVLEPSRQLKAAWDLSVFNFAGRANAPAPVLAHTRESEPNPELDNTEAVDAPDSAPATENVWAQLVAPLLNTKPSTPDGLLAALREAL